MGGDGNEYGPASAETVRTWHQEGRLNLRSLVREENGTAWLAYEHWESANSPEPVPAPDAGPENPVARAQPYPGNTAWPERYEPVAVETLDVVSCLSRSARLLAGHFAPLVAGTFLFTLVFLFMQILDYQLSVAIDFFGKSFESIPLITQLFRMISFFPFFSMLLSGVLMGGLYKLYLGYVRREQPPLTMVFSGFYQGFSQLILAGLASSVPTILGFFLFDVFSRFLQGFAQPIMAEPVLVLLTIAGFFLLIIPGIYLMVSWAFTFMLVADRRQGFWEAMETSRCMIRGNWWNMLLLLIAGSLVAASGLLLFAIGFFLTQPILFGAITYAYEDFSRRQPI